MCTWTCEHHVPGCQHLSPDLGSVQPLLFLFLLVLPSSFFLLLFVLLLVLPSSFSTSSTPFPSFPSSFFFIIILPLLPFSSFSFFFQEDREEERERNISVREKHPFAVSLQCPGKEQNQHPGRVPSCGIKPVNFYFMTPNQLRHTGQRSAIISFNKLPRGWCGSVDWVPDCDPKGCGFNSLSGHMLGLQARSPVWGMQEATTHDVPLPLFLLPFPSPLSKNKHIKYL